MVDYKEKIGELLASFMEISRQELSGMIEVPVEEKM